MQRRNETLAVAAKERMRRVGFEGVPDGLGRVRNFINNDVLLFTDFATDSVKNVPLRVAYVLNKPLNVIGCRDRVACRLPCYTRHHCSLLSFSIDSSRRPLVFAVLSWTRLNSHSSRYRRSIVFLC
jgi:hypothetical protein